MKSKDQKRKEAALRQAEYDAKTPEQKREGQSKKVLTKLNNPKKVVVKQPEAGGKPVESGTKPAPLTKEQRIEKERKRKEAIALHEAQLKSDPTLEGKTEIISAVPGNEERSDGDRREQEIPASFNVNAGVSRDKK